MITVKNAEFFSFIVASSLAYFMITIFSGYFQAWIAKKLGDDTAEEAGFLSLNPVTYIDAFGFFCFLIAGFGWGAMVPINPGNFRGKHKRLELLITYASRAVALSVLALVCLMIMVFFLGGLTSMYSAAVRQFPTPHFLVSHPALLNALRLVFGLMAHFSIFFTFYSLLIFAIRGLLVSYMGSDSQFISMEAELASFFICFLILYMFDHIISRILIFIIYNLELCLWHGWSWFATLIGLMSMY